MTLDETGVGFGLLAGVDPLACERYEVLPTLVRQVLGVREADLLSRQLVAHIGVCEAGAPLQQAGSSHQHHGEHDTEDTEHGPEAQVLLSALGATWLGLYVH